MANKLVVLAITVTLLTSCWKDLDPPAGNGKTRRELLTSHPWQATEGDLFKLLPDCQKDNYTIFDVYGKMNQYDAGMICDSVFLVYGTASWHFNEDETEIIVGNPATVVKILNLTEDELKISIESVMSGISRTFTTTYKKY